jgi:16S rRNA (cytosine1402-N4)-methyltransferase
MAEQYHIPALLWPAVDGLNIKPNGIYVDLTFGGGGHSKAILSKLGLAGKLIVFDQDPDAYLNKPEDDRIIFVRHNFRYLKNFLDYLNISKVDGILGDLGVSSHHFDSPERGFSFRFEGALDMRMNQISKVTAAELLNTLPREALLRLFRNYGEVSNPMPLVKAIEQFRSTAKFSTTSELKAVAEKVAPRKEQSKFLAQVFQALRIEVNGEMDVLREMLAQTIDLLNPGGRLVIIAYHSLEDRLVKNFIKSGSCDHSEAEKDIYGHAKVPFVAVTRKVIVPDEEEIALNSRARSAKLRIAERHVY